MNGGAEPDAYRQLAGDGELAPLGEERLHRFVQAILGAGRSLIEALHGERLDLLRRRSAIQAHAVRERGEGRLVAVKA